MAGMKDNTVTNIVSGGIASFKSVGEVPLKSLKVNFSPIQEGDGDPSPSNIRPISGWTGLNVFYTEKNLFNLNWLLTSTGTITDGVLRDPMYRLYNAFALTINPIPNTKYMDRITISVTAKTTQDYTTLGRGFTIKAKYDDGTNANLVYFSNATSEYTTLTGTSAVNKKVISLHVDYGSGGSNIWFIKDIMIIPGSNATTYEPYNGTTVPVSWSDLGTVYGGYVDLISGEVWQTYSIIDLSTLAWSTTSTRARSTGLQGTILAPASSNDTPEIICEKYNKIRSGADLNDHPDTMAVFGTGELIIKYSLGESLPSGNMVYKLAEPVLIGTIDPIEIKTLIGTNNIWSNADSVEVLYCALESLDIYKQRFKSNEPHLEIASGNIVSFTTDMISPLKECKVNFLPIQASGTPSPSNVLPISGWDELNIWHVDEIMPMRYITGETTNYGVTWTVRQDGTVHAEGTPTSYAGCTYADIDVNGDEILYGVIKGNLNNVAFNEPTLYDKNWNVISISGSDNILRDGLDLSQYTGVKTVRVKIKHYTNNVYMQGDTRVIVQKNIPPSINTTSITLPSTYYGGYVDLIKGELVATYGYKKFVGNEDWHISGGISGYCDVRPGYLNLIPAATGSGGAYYLAPISDKLKGQAAWATPIYNCTINDAGNFYFGAPEELSTKAAVNAWIQEIGGIEIAYPLRTPVTYQLTSQQIKTLKGLNNIWSNTNSTTLVKYWTHGNIADKRKVVWNNMVNGYLSADDWQDRDSADSSTTFENGVATVTFLNIETAVLSYHTMRSKNFTPCVQGEKYYASAILSINDSSRSIGIEFARVQKAETSPSTLNEWKRYAYLVTAPTSAEYTYMYIPYMGSGSWTPGAIAKVKSVIMVNLTKMFGAGNLPTLAEFEALCTKNGIDLTQYHPYNEGTEMYWYF